MFDYDFARERPCRATGLETGTAASGLADSSVEGFTHNLCCPVQRHSLHPKLCSTLVNVMLQSFSSISVQTTGSR